MSTRDSCWRAMTADDLGAVCAIAAEVHPDLPERPEVFAEKFQLFPRGCFALDGEAGLAGYAFAHPWPLHVVPPLDALLIDIPVGADCLYLHDAALRPEARGQSAAAQLIALLRAAAAEAGLPWLALVSVYGTGRLWSRFGFSTQDEVSSAKLASYGATAKYMTAPTV